MQWCRSRAVNPDTREGASLPNQPTHWRRQGHPQESEARPLLPEARMKPLTSSRPSL